MIFNLIYLLALVAATPYLLYQSIRRGKYRDGWGAKFLGLVPKLPPRAEGQKRLWFHAVSVGEVNLLKPLLAELAQTRPGWEFVVSATSKTGFELAQKLFADRARVFYCPLDFTWAVKRAVKRLDPSALVLVELELWPNLIKTATRLGVRVAIVNGRVGDGSFRSYMRARKVLAPTFRRIALVAAQDELAGDRFRKLSPAPDSVVVTGSVKFDGVETDRNNAKTLELSRLAGLRSDDVVFLSGSTQDPEELGALEVYRRLYKEYPRLKLIVVPRHKERFDDVAKALDASEFAWTRRSTLTSPVVAENAPSPEKDASRVVLIDSLGELGAWWGTAQIAFVGGSWGNRGGQNMLEPAAYGAAVSFGRNTRNFRTIVETLLRENAAQVVADVDEAEAFVKRCLTDVEYRTRLGAAAQKIVLRNRGAAKRTIDALVELVERQ